MSIQDLDKVLMYFYNNRNWYKYFEDLKIKANSNKEYTDIELQAILQKLVKDGYVIEEDQQHKKLKSEEVYTIYGYFITYDGMLLVEKLKGKFKGKPYEFLANQESKRKINEYIENIPKRFWYILAIIGYLVGLAAPILTEKMKSDNPKPSITLTIKNSSVQNVDTARHR